MENFGALGLLYWIIGCITNGLIAKVKNRSIVKVVISSILFSPATAYFYLLAVPAIDKPI